MKQTAWKRSDSRGFTLLELLIAISIFAIISSFAYGGLSVVLETKRQTEQRLQQLSRLQMAMTLLRRDVEQAAMREIRDEHGDKQPPLQSGSLGLLFELTRDGFSNPLLLSRSNLQRVGYLLEDDTLIRLSWPSLDRGSDDKPKRSNLLEDVKSVQLSFFDQNLKQHPKWPSSETEGLAKDDQPKLPRALEIKLELEQLGTITRLFRVAEGLPSTTQEKTPR